MKSECEARNVNQATRSTFHALRSERSIKMKNQLVVFNLANEDYGVDIAAVDGIVKG